MPKHFKIAAISCAVTAAEPNMLKSIGPATESIFFTISARPS